MLLSPTYARAPSEIFAGAPGKFPLSAPICSEYVNVFFSRNLEFPEPVANGLERIVEFAGQLAQIDVGLLLNRPRQLFRFNLATPCLCRSCAKAALFLPLAPVAMGRRRNPEDFLLIGEGVSRFLECNRSFPVFFIA
jgi:hypothetical protein